MAIENAVESVPNLDSWWTKNKRIVVKMCLNREQFYKAIDEAEQAGIRQRGLKPLRRKPKGFANEYIPNTKSLCRFFKICWRGYMDKLPEITKYMELKRIEAEAEAKRKELMGK